MTNDELRVMEAFSGNSRTIFNRIKGDENLLHKVQPD